MRMERQNVLFWVVTLAVILVAAVGIVYLFPQVTSWLTPG